MRNIEGKGGFRVGGTEINNLRYADDTVIIAETDEELQQLIDIVVRESEHRGLYLNWSKSFIMVFSKFTVIPTCNITIHDTSLEQVNSFIYLGNMFTSDGRCVQDVRLRIGIAKSAFPITGESIEIKRHQTPTENKSTEMICMINAIVRIGNMDTHQ